MTSKQPDILLIEDSLPDIRLAERALTRGLVPARVSVVRDGVEAMAFLRQQGPYGDVPRPDLILLDLGLPKKNGIEVLAEIKRDPELMSIPVVVLTNSDAEKDIVDTYNLHVNAYTKKPGDVDEYVKTINLIQEFWLNLAILPGRVP